MKITVFFFLSILQILQILHLLYYPTIPKIYPTSFRVAAFLVEQFPARESSLSTRVPVSIEFSTRNHQQQTILQHLLNENSIQFSTMIGFSEKQKIEFCKTFSEKYKKKTDLPVTPVTTKSTLATTKTIGAPNAVLSTTPTIVLATGF